jgi:hypothetical protein
MGKNWGHSSPRARTVFRFCFAVSSVFSFYSPKALRSGWSSDACLFPFLLQRWLSCQRLRPGTADLRIGESTLRRGPALLDPIHHRVKIVVAPRLFTLSQPKDMPPSWVSFPCSHNHFSLRPPLSLCSNFVCAPFPSTGPVPRFLTTRGPNSSSKTGSKTSSNLPASARSGGNSLPRLTPLSNPHSC